MRIKNNSIRDLVYVHLNENKQYVLSYGIEFAEFASSLSDRMNNILLLKHRFEDGDFNIHTMLEFVPNERFHSLTDENVYSYGDFCWMDFEEEAELDELSGQELAELLYLSHKKDHLKPPFSQLLRNRFVYLAHDDGCWNKVYYRNMKDFYRMLGDVLAGKMTELKTEKSVLGIKKKRTYPTVPIDIILNLKAMLKEGILLSIKDARQGRTGIEVPIWVLGDFNNMDDMYEEYEKVVEKDFDARIIFDKKTREWKLRLGNE